MSESDTNIFPEVIAFFGETLKDTADTLNCSIQTVANYRDGRAVPPELCIEIEKLTKGKFRCERLRSDVDWAFIRGTKKKVA